MAGHQELCCSMSSGTLEQQGVPVSQAQGLNNSNAFGSYFLCHLFPSLYQQKYKRFSLFSAEDSKFYDHNAVLKTVLHSDEKDTSVKVEKIPENISKDAKHLFEILHGHNIKTETFPYQPNKNLRAADDNTVYCKNLFLKDRRGQFYLVISHEDDKVNLKSLKIKLNAHRNFSFASSTEVEHKLGVSPGGVTPLALMHESAKDVKIAAYDSVTEMEMLNFHPLDPSYATTMTFPDLCFFLGLYGHSVEIIKH